MRFYIKSSSYHHYASTMPTMPLLCLYYAYYTCTMSTMPVPCLLCLLCLFITTDVPAPWQQRFNPVIIALQGSCTIHYTTASLPEL